MTTTNDKLFLFSVNEVYGVSQSGNNRPAIENGYMVLLSYGSSAAEGTQYTYFKTPENVIKKVNGSDSTWWLRSPAAGTNFGFRGVNLIGHCNYDSADNSSGILFGFSV